MGPLHLVLTIVAGWAIGWERRAGLRSGEGHAGDVSRRFESLRACLTRGLRKE